MRLNISNFQRNRGYMNTVSMRFRSRTSAGNTITVLVLRYTGNMIVHSNLRISISITMLIQDDER